ncbi:MAG: sigma-70 family RNA polymerase sigma factor [Termitinemataceae bacterium]
MRGLTDTPDEVLVSRIVAGERELFRVLIERHQKQVYGLGMSFFKDAEDAADFTQDVFIKAYQALSSFQGRSRFSTWLYRVAYNTAVTSLKRRQEYRNLLVWEELEVPAKGTPEDTVLRACALEALQQAIQELPDRYRVCIDLYFFYDRSYEEIAVITGFPLNTVKSHIFRAKQLLKEALQGG